MAIRTLHHLITDAGDSGLLLPMAMAGAALLWLFESRRLAWLLLRSVFATGLAILMLKLLFLSCGVHWVAELQSPSGHACLAAVVYGCLGSILCFGRAPHIRWSIGLVAAALILAIALSRISLGVHTGAEVIVGLAVGGAGWWWFARSAGALDPPRVHWPRFAAGLGITLALAFGIRLPAESLIRHFARHFMGGC